MLSPDQAAERAHAHQTVVLDSRTMGDGRTAALVMTRHPASIAEGSGATYEVRVDGAAVAAELASLQAATGIYNALDDAEAQSLHPAYCTIGDPQERPGMTHLVHAVGATPEDAVHALGQRFVTETGERDGAEAIVVEPDSKPDFQWFATFRLAHSKTSMKAAGINVPGGCLLTWWK